MKRSLTYRKKIIVFVMAVLIATAGFAQTAPGDEQEPWSLEACINYAKENNISIKRQRLNIDLAEKNLSESKYSFAPTLNASANSIINWGKQSTDIPTSLLLLPFSPMIFPFLHALICSMAFRN